jgi:hypothetical protein
MTYALAMTSTGTVFYVIIVYVIDSKRIEMIQKLHTRFKKI